MRKKVKCGAMALYLRPFRLNLFSVRRKSRSRFLPCLFRRNWYGLEGCVSCRHLSEVVVSSRWAIIRQWGWIVRETLVMSCIELHAVYIPASLDTLDHLLMNSIRMDPDQYNHERINVVRARRTSKTVRTAIPLVIVSEMSRFIPINILLNELIEWWYSSCWWRGSWNRDMSTKMNSSIALWLLWGVHWIHGIIHRI